MVPMAGMGTMASGFLVKYFAMSCEKTMKFSIMFLIMSLILSPMYLIYCDHSPVVGVETSYPPPDARFVGRNVFNEHRGLV